MERRLTHVFTTAKTQREIVERFERYAQLVTDKEADLISPFQKGLSKADGVQLAFFDKEIARTIREKEPVAVRQSEAQVQRIRILKLKYKYQR